MPEVPTYPPIKKLDEEQPKVIKVDKPGSIAPKSKPIKFRPLRADKRGRARKFKNDHRYVEFY